MIEIKKNIRKLFSYKNNKKNKLRLKNKNFTIIASNCIGGVIYHNLKMKFLSPTINMYFESQDFIKFCSNIKHYVDSELVFISNAKDGYPIVQCDDIKLYCVHYKDFNEVKEKWRSRSKRINWNNIFIIMSERDGCTYEDIKKFDLLPFNNKVIFVHKDMPEIKSSYYIPGTELNGIDGQHIIPLTSYVGKFTGKRYIDYFDYVEFLNSGSIEAQKRR